MNTHLLDTVTSWAKSYANICGLAIVGSYARGNQQEDSDIDLIIVSPDRHELLNRRDWLETFGEVESIHREDYGANQVLRVFYKGGTEIEYGLVLPGWLKIPLDSGTRRVLSDGAKIFYDPLKLFCKALENIHNA